MVYKLNEIDQLRASYIKVVLKWSLKSILYIKPHSFVHLAIAWFFYFSQRSSSRTRFDVYTDWDTFCGFAQNVAMSCI